MKVLVVICVLFVAAVHANPAFRALRARASGLGGGTAPPLPNGQTVPTPVVQPDQLLFQPLLRQPQQYQSQPQQYQSQPQQYQAQPQYQAQNQQRAPAFGSYSGVPFGGYQQVQG